MHETQLQSVFFINLLPQFHDSSVHYQSHAPASRLFQALICYKPNIEVVAVNDNLKSNGVTDLTALVVSSN